MCAARLVGLLLWGGGLTLHAQEYALQPGDVMMVRGNTAVGRFVLSVSGEEAKYSHCGMVVMTDAGPAVAHAAPASAQTGDTGVVAAVALMDFLKRDSVEAVDIYRHRTAASAQRAAEAAWGYVQRATPFDSAMDLTDESRLYCTELVWRAYQAAGEPCLVGGRFDRVRSIFTPDEVILPATLAASEQLEYVGPIKRSDVGP